jgi:hypothetical protein
MHWLMRTRGFVVALRASLLRKLVAKGRSFVIRDLGMRSDANSEIQLAVGTRAILGRADNEEQHECLLAISVYEQTETTCAKCQSLNPSCTRK